MSVAVCHTCGGYGKDGGCPKCGKTLEGAIKVKSLRLDIAVDVIPVQYQGKLWSRPESTGNTRFDDFDSKLDTIHKEFLSGRVPKFSVMACSPGKYGKHRFAYSCMQTAVVQGFTVAPLLVTSDWRRLYRVSQTNPFYRLYDKYKWDDLVALDVVFLAVDHSDDRFDVISLLKDLLDVRAGFSKSTFIISDFKLTDLVPTWGKQNYNLIYNPDPERDFMRYPVILHRFD